MTPRSSQRALLVSLHTSPLDQPGSGDAGGMNVYVSHLARALVTQGWSVDMATLERDSANGTGVDAVDVAPGLRLLTVALDGAAAAPKEDLPHYAAAFGDALTGFYTQLRPDVVHAHYWLSGVAGQRVAEAFHIPLLLSLHTSAAVKNLRAGPGENPEPEAREEAERTLVHGACTTVVNTPAEAAQMVEYYGAAPERVQVIPPGVDPAIFHPPAGGAGTAAEETTRTPFTVLCAGRMQPLKGQQILVEALGLLRRQHPETEVRLVLAGIGAPDFVNELHRRVAGLALHDVVDFVGSISREALAELMRSVDAVAMPSSSETFGLVAVEAQACGTPVLATDVDGLRYAVQDGVTGRLVPGRDPATWAAALYAAASDPRLWRDMGHAAVTRTRDLTWETAAARHARLYAACTERRVTA